MTFWEFWATASWWRVILVGIVVVEVAKYLAVLIITLFRKD